MVAASNAPRIFFACVFCLICIVANAAFAVEVEADVLTVNDAEITIEAHRARGEIVAIWLPSEAGPQPADEKLANELAKRGVEVWRVDLVEAHFLPVVTSSVDKLPVQDISALLEHARKTTGKKVVFISTGRGAIPVLRGLHQWLLNGGDGTSLLGVVLFSPKFFVETPDPGLVGELMPIVSASNLPIYIIQPDQSPWYWKLPQTLPAFESGGSDVYVRILRKVRDRYYFRPDATDREMQLTTLTPNLVLHSLQMLSQLPIVNRKVTTVTQSPPEVRTGKKDRVLSKYYGDPVPPPLRLSDLKGRTVDLQQLRGKVVLLNFWATWCPPCVHEMPSMQRLKEKLQGKPFLILAVNMGEDEMTVTEFLNSEISVDFPILYDFDGKALKDWRVYAFPTSFVVDKNGMIQYGLFGGFDWDTEDVVNKLTVLLEP